MLLFVNDLTVIDFSYLCAERGMVGESWIVDVVLDGGLDEQNMVLDFAKVKKTIKRTIDDVLDHRLAVPMLSSASSYQDVEDEMVRVDFNSAKGSIHLRCPEQAFSFIDSDVIDHDSTIQFLNNELKKVLPDNVLNIELTLRAEELNRPYYHYSHGLKKHDGNCQRIAHGHRSPISVFIDGEESQQWNEYWAQRWQDIYLGTEEDIVKLADLDVNSKDISDQSHFGFKYQAPQGEFQLAISKEVCDIIPHDTTVELLADFVAQYVANESPNTKVLVKAYEGVGKGAIAKY
ncbi:6-carboxytetrahydropterin synthase [Parashewanella tropica]|uniref:6-carboxytetrahydropterin synthase n=1 Tax=Parashewanella tropica TaxID=2547970 RepID=UPI00105A25F2|nr:6-carboxytetrahydropterin synthase [Parashewanella tropica]